MAVYNGDKQDSKIGVGATHVASGCRFGPIARWKHCGRYGHYGHYGPQYEIRNFHTQHKYQIYLLSSAVRMFHVQINISNRTPQSGILLQDVTVVQLVKKFPVNCAKDGQYRVYKSPPPFAVPNQTHPVKRCSHFLKNTFQYQPPSSALVFTLFATIWVAGTNSVSISQC
jgi:hypothetical protein